MATTKPFVTVTLKIHGGTTETIADYLDDDKFVNLGTQAAAAIQRREAIHYVTQAGVETLIPFHAIDGITITRADGEYTKPADDFCEAIECITAPMCGDEGDDDIVLLDGTYTFEQDEDVAAYGASLDKCYEPASVTVTVDGTTATLPEAALQSVNKLYGEFGEGEVPVFTTYPAAVILDKLTTHGSLMIAVPSVGSHTVKVTVPNGSEVNCNDK